MAFEVRKHFPSLPMVFASLGVLPYLEQPPFINLNIARYLALSEEVKGNLISKGIPVSSIHIYRNIADSGKFRPIREIGERPLSALIYSYRMDDGKAAVIMEACKHLGIKCQWIGGKQGWIHQDNVATFLNEADIVFTLGRGVVETMMCGKIPIVYDYLGGDGMVTPGNILDLAKCNFSGRCYRFQYRPEDLVNEIKKYCPENGLKLRQAATDLFDADRRVDILIENLKAAKDCFSSGRKISGLRKVEGHRRAHRCNENLCGSRLREKSSAAT